MASLRVTAPLLILLLSAPPLAHAGPVPGRDAWTHEALDAIWARPLVGQGDGRVVVGAEDGILYAFEAGGRLLWSYKASEGFCGWPVQLKPGDPVAVANRNGNLYLVDGQGEVKQKIDLGGVAPGPPGAHRGRLFFATRGGRVLAVEGGAVAWTYPGAAKASLSWPAVDAAGVVYAGFGDGQVVALGREGQVRWKVEVKASPPGPSGKDEGKDEGKGLGKSKDEPNPAAVTGAMALVGRGKAAALVLANVAGDLVGLAVKDGAELWRGRHGPAPGGVAPLGAGVVFGTSAGMIMALDARGKARWKLAADGPIMGLPTVEAGLVIVGSDRGTLYFLDRAGRPVALHGADGAVRGAARVSRGRVLFGTAGRRLHVLPLPSRARATWDVAAGLKARLEPTPRGRLRWRRELSGPVARGVARVKGGKLLAGTLGRKAYLLRPDGGIIWSYNCGEDVDTLPAMGRGGEVAFGCNDGGFYGLRPDGEMAYRYPVNKALSSSPALARDGTVYFGARDRRVYALDRQGKIRWKVLTGDDVDSAPRIGPDGMVYVGSDDRHLYAIDPQGRILWYYRTAGAVRSRPALSRDGKAIYFTGFDQRLHAVDPRGAPIWSYQSSGQLFSSPVVGPDGSIYFGSRDHSIYAVGADGKLRWRFGTAGEVDSTPALLGTGDKLQVAVGSDDGNLYVLSAASGKLAWWFPAGAEVRGDLAVGKDGAVILGAMDGSVLAVAPPGGGPPDPAPAQAGESRRTLARLGHGRAGPVLPLAGGGFVVAGADGKVRAVGADGWPLWTAPVGNERLGAMVAHGPDLYLSDNRGHLVALRGGRVRFRLRLHRGPLTAPVLAPAGGKDPMLLVGSQAGRVWAISRQGKVRWFYSGSDTVSRPLLASGSGAAAVLGQDLVGIDGSGNEAWDHKLPGGAMAGPVRAAGRTVVADGLGVLHAVDSAGKPAWTRDLGAPARLLASSVGERSLLAATDDGRLLELAGDGEPLFETDLPARAVRLLPLSIRGCLVFTAGGAVLQVDLATGRWHRLADLGGEVLDARSAAGGRVLVTSSDGRVSVIQAK